MAEVAQPRVYSIPPHRSFVDALAAGLLARHGDDPLALARGVVLLPNQRSCRALSDAFVRLAGDRGILLPRMTPIGDLDLDEAAGLMLDSIEGGEDLPAVIDGCERRLLLARMVRHHAQAEGAPIGVAEAVRLAGQLGRTLDQLIAEEVPPQALHSAVADDVAHHWQQTLRFLNIIVDLWPDLLAARGQMDGFDRRNRMFDRLAATWAQSPPAGFVVAAGIANAPPAVARLLKVIARLERGEVVMPGLDRTMPDDEWAMLGPLPEDEDGIERHCDSHPQSQMKLLLDRMGVNRREVRPWRWGAGNDAPAGRTRAVAFAMAPAEATGKWQQLQPRDRRLPGVRFFEAATIGDEAQAIALALRQALDVPQRTAALVTPDRGLARRVSAHLKRWGITIDDSAGQPLSRTPPGAFLTLLAEAAAEGFAPVALLSLLKHPLTRAGDARRAWLDDVRQLDKALRGPRPPAGIDGLNGFIERLAEQQRRRWLTQEEVARLGQWWRETAALLQPLEQLFAAGEASPAELIGALIAAGGALAGDDLWAGPAGRAASELMRRISEYGDVLGPVDPAELPGLLVHMMDEVAVRLPVGGHPRLAIYGLIEARLQRADLMILGSLNEGVWPALPSPDPWLAPRIRAELGLPGLERRIGLAAHDLVSALGAPQVIVTRARRDESKPTIASRFWLRLDAMTGGVPRQPLLPAWAAALDSANGRAAVPPAERPAPCPPADRRPRRISVTAVDRLKADPYSFYAQTMLGLSRPDAVDTDPSAAERGTAVHDILEKWVTADGGRNPDELVRRARAMLAEWSEHPLLRVLWAPRVLRAVEWAAAELARNREDGWAPLIVEQSGHVVVDGIRLQGRPDRIDRNGAGELAVIDYKTGKPPSYRQLAAGFALQLGLVGWMAAAGAFEGVSGKPTRFEYWRLSGGRKEAGRATDPRQLRGKVQDDVADLAEFAIAHFREAAARYLHGSEPFTAKLHPQYAVYSDFDQLARVAEWMGRGRG